MKDQRVRKTPVDTSFAKMQNNTAGSEPAEVWHGFYRYGMAARGCPFTATLTFGADGVFMGWIVDAQSDWAWRGAPESAANGQMDSSGGVHFRKQYMSEFLNHVVEYDGTLIGGNIITGWWHIGPYSGTFEMRRAKRSGAWTTPGTRAARLPAPPPFRC